ncbi:phosphoadenosine phosphosulfate sulfotransferase [Paraburkholderia sp. J8-2]|uniref:phosphoadenosine phosphosulfate sulfotransferase n=1 Tax=Paraburkholderia sp. J8-2 TaxID=2805440 RepID=UPI002AB65ABD|nr:phosphoadenosine phosphosulfate sulfotransferase [Paraburkholderia sp. J8-2]
MKYATFPLFEEKVASIPVEDQIQCAVRTVKRLMIGSWQILVATSGKDSGLVCAIVLHAAHDITHEINNPRSLRYRRARGQGLCGALVARRNLKRSLVLRAALGKQQRPEVIFTSSDTRIENSEISAHVRKEFERIEAFAKKSGFTATTHLVEPSLLSTWQVSILSGRAIPSYAGMKGDCSVSLKITPQRSFRRRLFDELKAHGRGKAATMLGTRFGESKRRGILMKSRGDRADRPVLNKDGEYVLSPIAFMTTDDVWESLALYASGMWPSYSDFSDTMRIYADAGGTSCAVVADAIFEGSQSKSGGCGQRFGCVLCQQSEDKSLANMVAYDKQYEYASGLLKLNQFIRNIRYDWKRRNWVGRTIRAGYVAIGPDTFHPATLRELSRYMLQLDYDERRRATRAGEQPKFQLLPLDILVALDATMSLYGVARPFSLWADIRDIEQRGIRYDVPEIPPAPVQPVPETRFLFVGTEWDDSAVSDAFTGLRDPYWEALTEIGCQPELVEVAPGKMAWKLNTEQSFSVDMESACLMIDFEMERMLQYHDGYLAPGAVTWAYQWYLQYGVITVAHGHQRKHDEVCRRTSFKDRLGLTLDYDHESVIGKSVRYKDLPEDARREWANKARTDASQADFWDDAPQIDVDLDLFSRLAA